MIPINSEMESKIFPLHVLAELLKPQGGLRADQTWVTNTVFLT